MNSIDPDSFEAEPRDEASGGDNTIWLRLLFMFIFLVLYAVSRVVVVTVVVLQFFLVLFKGEPNLRLSAFGLALAEYTYQIISYLTFNTELRPFPFDRDWPADYRP